MTICIFGDSITWGAYDAERGGWANMLRNYFQEHEANSEVYPLGIPGDTTDELLKRIQGEAQARRPDRIIFAIGINDAQYVHSTSSVRISVQDFEKNLQKLLTIAKRFTGDIMFVGPTRVDESKTSPTPWHTDTSYLNEHIDRIDQAIQNFCEEQQIQYIAMNDILTLNDLYDGLHPNTQGHVKIYNRILPELTAVHL